MKTNLFFFFVLTLFVSCRNSPNNSRVDALPYYSEATFTPLWVDGKDDLPKNYHKIAEFALTNQDGKMISDLSFHDKIYVTDFFFTSCPGICPKMTKNMGVLQDTFLTDPEILLLSHSVTPTRDSVPELKLYADSKDIISEKWHLVTGNRKTIYDLGRKSYFIEENLGLEMEVDDFIHTENFVLIDKNRHIRGIYNGLNLTSIQQLISDIRLLKKEE